MVRSVVVTGADSGIGLVSVIELAAAGDDVVGTVQTEVVARASTPTGSASSPTCSAPTSGPRRRSGFPGALPVKIPCLP